MDDAERAELAALRRRAYGPDADIAGDATALARLAELETQLHRESVPERPVYAPDAADAAASPPRPTRDGSARGSARPDSPTQGAAGAWIVGTDSAARDGANPRLRRRMGTVALASAIAIVIAVALDPVTARDDAAPPAPTGARAPIIEVPPEESSFTNDPSARVLQQIPVGNPFGNGAAYAAESPSMPASGPLRWAEWLGDYYGWEVWIAGASGASDEQLCLLIRRGARSEGRCVTAALRSVSSLLVDVDYTDIPPHYRPAGMTSSQRLGFWWHEDSTVTALLGTRLALW